MYGIFILGGFVVQRLLRTKKPFSCLGEQMQIIWQHQQTLSPGQLVTIPDSVPTQQSYSLFKILTQVCIT
jgi:hypothetical protein